MAFWPQAPVTAKERKMADKKAELESKLRSLMDSKANEPFAPDTRAQTAAKVIRRWKHTYHYASAQPVEGADTLVRLMAVSADAMFPVNDWLVSIAKPGERITVTVQW